MLAPMTPRMVPPTFDAPERRRTVSTGASTIRRRCWIALTCISTVQP